MWIWPLFQNITSYCTYGMDMFDKGMIHIPERGQSGLAQDFITQLRTVHNAKLWIANFWNFPFNILGLQLSEGNQNHGKQNQHEGEYYIKCPEQTVLCVIRYEYGTESILQLLLSFRMPGTGLFTWKLRWLTERIRSQDPGKEWKSHK